MEKVQLYPRDEVMDSYPSQKRILRYAELALISLTSVVIVSITVEFGLRLIPDLRWQAPLRALDLLLVFIFSVYSISNFLISSQRISYLREKWFDLLILVLVITFSVLPSRYGGPKLARYPIILRQVIFAIRLTKLRQLSAALQLRPAQVIASSFFIAIMFGTVLLMLPAASSDGKGADFLTALFTSTSATCVTGLIVVDTPTYFSKFGQIVILCLIQLGGLGIMTFSVSAALIFTRRMGIKERAMIGEFVETVKLADLTGIIRYVISMTLTVEILGALILFVRWCRDFGNYGKAAYTAIFHSISAFCNAGFSLFSDSLVRYVGDITVNLTITFLIIIGGIGFVVVNEVTGSISLKDWRKRLSRVSVHTKLVLSATLVLLVIGMIFIFFFEFDGALRDLPLKDKLLAAYFHSVTPRTAGFNTLEISAFSNVTLFITIALMFIGASPGSTGGGIKTSTFGILILSVKSMLLERDEVEIFNRTIPKRIVYKSISIAVISFSFLTVMFALLLISEKSSFTDILFEAFSAFGTVGLSTGMTPQLSGPGRVFVIMLMFVGRIGPLTIALAIREKRHREAYSFPEGSVMVG